MDKIVIKGAKEHNLKDVDLEIPRNKLVIVTGLSGSGKSSLAFDTIYAEGQRRYVESLSAYARQFLGQMENPMSILSRAFHRRYRSTRKAPRKTPFYGRDGDGDSRLPAPFICAHRPSALPKLQKANCRADDPADC